MVQLDGDISGLGSFCGPGIICEPVHTSSDPKFIL